MVVDFTPARTAHPQHRHGPLPQGSRALHGGAWHLGCRFCKASHERLAWRHLGAQAWQGLGGEAEKRTGPSPGCCGTAVGLLRDCNSAMVRCPTWPCCDPALLSQPPGRPAFLRLYAPPPYACRSAPMTECLPTRLPACLLPQPRHPPDAVSATGRLLGPPAPEDSKKGWCEKNASG